MNKSEASSVTILQLYAGLASETFMPCHNCMVVK